MKTLPLIIGLFFTGCQIPTHDTSRDKLPMPISFNQVKEDIVGRKLSLDDNHFWGFEKEDKVFLDCIEYYYCAKSPNSFSILAYVETTKDGKNWLIGKFWITYIRDGAFGQWRIKELMRTVFTHIKQAV